MAKDIKHDLLSSAAMEKLANWSKNKTMPGANGYTFYEVWQSFAQQLRRTSLPERAAAISFNVFMAIPPILIFVFTLIPYLPISRQFTRAIFSLIRDIVPGKQNNTAIIQFLFDFIHKPRNGLLSFGLFLALFFSSNAMMGILRSFDRNYEGFYRRKTVRKRQTALKLTLIVFVLVFCCLLLLVAQGAVLQWIGIESSPLRTLIKNVRWVIIILLVFYFTSFIYRHGPALRKKWPLLTPGAVFATTLTIIATFLVSFWVNHFSNYNKLYGSIGAIFILMSLIYVNALVILLGFELNVSIASLKPLIHDRKKEAIASPIKKRGNYLKD